LLDAKLGTETERMKYFFSFISRYSFDTFLDLGCGKGLLFDNVSSSDKTKLLVGVDLMRTRKRHYQHVVASATKLPFKNGFFSLVTAFSLVEHIPKAERDMFYEEARRVAKREGVFVIQLPNRYFVIESHTYFPFFGFLPSNMHSFAYRQEYVAVPSLKEVTCSLKRLGFEECVVEKYEGQFLPFQRFLSKIRFFSLFPVGYMIHTAAKER
jgi:ubiquinone/menaquinone biosynthesis C-methylase UbiE